MGSPGSICAAAHFPLQLLTKKKKEHLVLEQIPETVSASDPASLGFYTKTLHVNFLFISASATSSMKKAVTFYFFVRTNTES